MASEVAAGLTGNPPPDEAGDCCASMTCTSRVHDGAATAVRGISLRSVHTGEIVGPGRGVRQRQDADLPGRPRRAAAGLRASSAARSRSAGSRRDAPAAARLGAAARQPASARCSRTPRRT